MSAAPSSRVLPATHWLGLLALLAAAALYAAALSQTSARPWTRAALALGAIGVQAAGLAWTYTRRHGTRAAPALSTMLLLLSPAFFLISLPAAYGASLGFGHALPWAALLVVALVPLVLALRAVRLDPPSLARLRVNVLATAISTLLGLGVLETAVRLLHADPGPPPPTFRETPFRTVRSPSPRIGWELAPNQKWKTVYPSNERGYFEADNSVRYRTNAQGFRGDDFSVARRPGALRIALLGDSFAFGLGVKEQDTLARQLEKDLGAPCPIEVINFGVLGYSTDQEEALLRKKVLAYAPDLVMVWYFLNDPEIEGTLRFLGEDHQSFFPWARRFSALARLVGARLDADLSIRSLIRTYTEAYRQDDPRWQTVEAAFARFARTAQERHLPILLFVHPVLFRLDATYPFAAVHRQVLAAATKAGLPAFDLFPAFEGRRAEDLWVHRSDQHPNEVGHALAAAYAAAKLKPFLPSCPPAAR